MSAIQARGQLSLTKADVVVLFVGVDDDVARASATVCARHGIVFQLVPPAAIDDLPPNFARHFLDRLLDARYHDVMHVDGDTQILASLDPVIDAPLPPGRILAVPDPMAVMIHSPGRAWEARRDYFHSIGLRGEQPGRYINSGVFRANRSDLAAIGSECLRLCEKNGPRFVFGEQDALNVAFGREILLMSFRWNFPVFFLNFDYGALIEPHLHHFMSNPRPWQGAFRPWGRAPHLVYRHLVDEHPELRPLLRPFPRRAAARYRAQQLYKRLTEPAAWNAPFAKARIREFEAHAAV